MLSNTCFYDAIGDASSGFLTRYQRNHATIGVYVSGFHFVLTSSQKRVKLRSRYLNCGGFGCDGFFCTRRINMQMRIC